MSLAAQPIIEPGRAYRTHEFRRWSANPTRLAKRLVREGDLRQVEVVDYPYTARWRLEPGDHSFQARTAAGEWASGRVRVSVN